MDRRRILLIVAAAVAALGTALVFLYVRGADDRAQEQVAKVPVLQAVQQIAPGESLASAQESAKISLVEVPADQKLVNGQTEITDAMKTQVALTTIYPGEQILAEKFGTQADIASPLQIPAGAFATSVNLTDPARVAGFVNPGSQVSVYFSGTDEKTGKTFTRMLMPKVNVLGVGSTTPVSTTTTTAAVDGAAAAPETTTEQLPRTLLTLALDAPSAARIIYAQANGELSFALRTGKSTDALDPETITMTNLFDNISAAGQ